jgi:hypothetical protein
VRNHHAHPVLIRCSDQFAQLTHMMACLDRDDWLTDVFWFKMAISKREVENSSAVAPPFKYYAAVV